MIRLSDRKGTQPDSKKRRRPGTRTITAAVVLAVLAVCAVFVYAAEPGSGSDPIALKSYVDKKIMDLESKLTSLIGGDAQPGKTPSGGSVNTADTQSAELLATLEDLTKRVDTMNQEIASIRQTIRRLSTPLNEDGGAFDNGGDTSDTVNSGEELTSSGDGFTVTEFKAGERIIMGAGTELILRTGEALAIRGELGCVLDLITSRDLDAGETVPINHLLISARDDSRGIRIEKDSYVMIKGAYTLR